MRALFLAANNIHEAKECFTIRFMSSVDKNDCIGQTGARVGRRKELRSNNDHPLIGLAWWSARLDGGTVILVMVLVNGIGGGL